MRKQICCYETGWKIAVSPHLQRGLTLVEALITLVVVSVGLLGIAALQVVALQEGGASARHSQAVWLAYDMADRMRANSVENPGAGFPIPGGLPAPGAYANIVVPGDEGAEPACGPGNECAPAVMARYDMHRWLDGIQALPGDPDASPPVTSTGRIDFFPGTGGGLYRIRIQWNEVRASLGDNPNPVAQAGCPTEDLPPFNPNQVCVELWVQP